MKTVELSDKHIGIILTALRAYRNNVAKIASEFNETVLYAQKDALPFGNSTVGEFFSNVDSERDAIENLYRVFQELTILRG